MASGGSVDMTSGSETLVLQLPEEELFISRGTAPVEPKKDLCRRALFLAGAGIAVILTLAMSVIMVLIVASMFAAVDVKNKPVADVIHLLQGGSESENDFSVPSHRLRGMQVASSDSSQARRLDDASPMRTEEADREASSEEAMQDPWAAGWAKGWAQGWSEAWPEGWALGWARVAKNHTSNAGQELMKKAEESLGGARRLGGEMSSEETANWEAGWAEGWAQGWAEGWADGWKKGWARVAMNHTNKSSLAGTRRLGA
jgi:hypothetical protein